MQSAGGRECIPMVDAQSSLSPGGTSCHLSIAIFLLNALQCRYGGAGAVWDIFARNDANCSDTKQLSHWLAGNASSFMHQGEAVEGGSFTAAEADSHAPIMSQQFMLNAQHRAQLRRDTGEGGCHLGLMVCWCDLSAHFLVFGRGLRRSCTRASLWRLVHSLLAGRVATRLS